MAKNNVDEKNENKSEIEGENKFASYNVNGHDSSNETNVGITLQESHTESDSHSENSGAEENECEIKTQVKDQETKTKEGKVKKGKSQKRKKPKKFSSLSSVFKLQPVSANPSSLPGIQSHPLLPAHVVIFP